MKGNKEKIENITTISPKRAGITLAITTSAIYLVCVFVIMRVPREMAIDLYNNILHGLDVSGILKPSMTISQMAAGLISVFIIGWLVGATFASIYNLVGEYVSEE